MDYSSGKKPSEYAINQYRSWQIMEKYFGITQGNSVYVGFNVLPPHLKKELDKLRDEMLPRIEELEKKKALLN